MFISRIFRKQFVSLPFQASRGHSCPFALEPLLSSAKTTSFHLYFFAVMSPSHYLICLILPVLMAELCDYIGHTRISRKISPSQSPIFNHTCESFCPKVIYSQPLGIRTHTNLRLGIGSYCPAYHKFSYKRNNKLFFFLYLLLPSRD